MHITTRLDSNDFQFFRYNIGNSNSCKTITTTPTVTTITDTERTDPIQQHQPLTFDDFCPNYHELDRVGIVSPTLEAGIYNASYAVLALATAFYSKLKASSNGDDDSFFDYPTHFAFVGTLIDTNKICTGNGPLSIGTPDLWDAWSWLDVYPDNKWIPTTPVSAKAMLLQVFDYQINRLFWPRSMAQQDENDHIILPPYVWKMLRTRLKVVYYYYDDYSNDDNVEPSTSLAAATGDDETSILGISIKQSAKEIVQESIDMLPKIVQEDTTNIMPCTTSRNQYFELVHVDDFLSTFNRTMIISKSTRDAKSIN